jgi:two-component system, response regulator
VSVPKLVVIEDNPDYQDLIVLAIEREMTGVSAVYFKDGSSALAFLMSESVIKNPPSVIITDLRLPNIDGRDITSAMRKHPKLSGIPVVVLSTSDLERDRQSLLSSGANAYFTKPHTFTGLRAIIREIRGRWLQQHPVTD